MQRWKGGGGGVGGSRLALKSIGILTQDAEPGSTTFNGA